VETSSHDVLLVGGGGAALRAAIAVSEINPKLSVAVVSKVYPMRSHTVSAEGGAAGVIAEDDTYDEHAYDTISGGDWLSDQDCVEIFVHEAPKELLRLENWGCPWSRREDGKIAVRPFGGMKKMRTWFAADKTGFHMLHTLFQTSLRYPVTRYDETFVTKLMVEDGRVCGVVAIELKTGKVRVITAKAVIICTGGCGRVFPYTTNANICTGDGMALAYEAGAPLKDMEMVQYHPTGLPFTGILITEASRAEGGLLVNKDGYRYLQDYNLGKPQKEPVLRTMELGPRDRLSQAFVKEMEKGRTIKGPYGDVVHLDLRHLGEEKINAKLPMVRELCVKYENIDPVHEMIPVRPVQHYMMGGVHTDTSGATPLKGLYAAGEAACVSLNGSNRLGSNSLGELLVFGAREAMQHTMEAGAGIYRTRVSLAEAADKIAEMQERYRTISMEDHSLAFNTQLIAALELGFLLDVAETILQCALQREESRGAHQRIDFPERDDTKFLAHSMVSRGKNGRPEVSYLPVTITRWPPGKRVYGEQTTDGGHDSH
jgi:fumarate reductase flavoprotein subunit